MWFKKKEDNYDLLKRLEKNAGGWPILNPKDIYRIADTYYLTGNHDVAFYPQMKVREINNNAIEIYYPERDLFIIVTLLPQKNYQSFPMKPKDKKEMGPETYMELVDWFIERCKKTTSPTGGEK